jgi:MarR family transcriptional regulator, organic hydroperoxide resistance regulator
MESSGAATRPLEADPFDGALAFVRLLWQVNHGLQAASKRMERDLGVTGTQRLAVRVLGSSPGMTPGQLARVLHLDPGTITGVVQRLRRAGLVRRAVDPHDGRRFLLALTGLGRQLAARRSGTIEERAEAALAALGPDEVAAAHRALAAVAALLDDEGATHRAPAP